MPFVLRLLYFVQFTYFWCHVQDKIQSMAGQQTDVLEALSPIVRKRVQVLREIQVRLPLNFTYHKYYSEISVPILTT